MARRVQSLHHNLQPGQNVVFHREHRSKKGRVSIDKWVQRKVAASYKAERKYRIIDRHVNQRLREIVRNNDFGRNVTA